MNITDNWNYRITIENETHRDFISRARSLGDEVLSLNSFRVQNYADNGKNNDNELKILMDRNKQLCQEIDTKVAELVQQRTQYDGFKREQKLLAQDVKDTHEAFLMAKKYYKKYLKIYYTIEARDGDKQTIFFQFFTEARKVSEKYSIRLQRDTKTERYELLQSNPKLNSHEELKKILHETNDIPRLLCSVRKAFMNLISNDKKVHKS